MHRLVPQVRHVSKALLRSQGPIFKRSIQTAFAFSENGSHQPQPPPSPPPRYRSWRWPAIIMSSIFFSYGVFKYYTRHNFPPEVAAKLREGLRAEIDGNGKGAKDYNLALEKYLEALKIADELGMSHVTDEYTGLQIKICEMYEKLGKVEEARLMYRELGVSFIQALNSQSVPAALRPHLIQRDLRVALKTALNEAAKDPNMAKMGLLVHFKIAQGEVASKDSDLKELIQNERAVRSSLVLSIDTDYASKHKEKVEAWQPFRDELFNARDMYVALCLATGDVGHALETKLATTEWMTTAGCDIGQILMSFYNVGSIFYIQAEELEVRELNQSGKDAEFSRNLAHESIENSSKCFSGILDVVGNLPSNLRRENEVTEVQAMSIYGLGVIALHRGDLKLASERLREARLRAKGCELHDLMNSAEIELNKLEKIMKESDKGKNNKYESPTMDVLLMRKDHEAEDNGVSK